jgi:putative metallohydrolase (TIGR04338 family)
VRARRGVTAAHYEYDGNVATVAVPERETTWALRELVVFFGHFTAVYAIPAKS